MLYLKRPDKLTSVSLTPDLIVGKQWILNIGAETPDFTTVESMQGNNKN